MNFTYDYEQSFLSNSHKQIHIMSYSDYAYRGYISDYGSMHLTNENLVKEQFRLEEKVSDSDHIEYGSMYASMVEFTVRADTCQDQLEWLKTNKCIKILMNFGWNNQMYYDTLFYLGNYVVTDMEYTNGENEVKITAYDPLILIRDLDIAPWLKSKWGDTTTNANDDKILGDLVMDLFNDLIQGSMWDYDSAPYPDSRIDLLKYVGVEYNYGTFGDIVNYDMKVSYPSTVEALSLGDFLKSVAEMNGCCLHYVANREYFNDGNTGYSIAHPFGFIEFLSFKTYASPEGQEADHIIYNRYRRRGDTKLKNYITPKVKKIRAFNASGEWISTYTKGWKKQNAIYSINDNLFLRDYNRMVQKQTIYNTDELISKVWHYYPGSQMMQGDECKSIQTRLNELGLTPELQVDGKYGLNTANGVKWFQEGYVDPDDPTHTLAVTGEVNEETALALGFMFELGAQYSPGGADTWPQIERVLKYVKNGAMMEGSDVLAVQRALNSKGSQYTVVENGIYNTQTRDAVKKWQQTIGHEKPNGRVADSLTCSSLSLTWNPYVKDEETVNAVHSSLENIYKLVNDNRYIPFSVKCVGNPCMNVGEKLSVYDQTREQKINKSYCLHRVLSGIQMMVDEVEAKGSEEKETFAVYNTSESGSTTVSGGSGTELGNVETLMSDGSVYGLDQINFIELVRNLGLRFPNEPTKVKVVEGTKGDMTVKFKWTDPSNITNEKPQKSKWAGTVVVRKAGSAPLHRWDFKKATGGVLAEYSGKANKSKYKDTFLIDDGTVLPPRVAGQTYYYGIFPYDENGHYRYTKVIKIGGSDKDDSLEDPYVSFMYALEMQSTQGGNIGINSSLQNATYKFVIKKDGIPSGESDGLVFDVQSNTNLRLTSEVRAELDPPGQYGWRAVATLSNGSKIMTDPCPIMFELGEPFGSNVLLHIGKYTNYVSNDKGETMTISSIDSAELIKNGGMSGREYNKWPLRPFADYYATGAYAWKLSSSYGVQIYSSYGAVSGGRTFELNAQELSGNAIRFSALGLKFFSLGDEEYTYNFDASRNYNDFIAGPGFALGTCTFNNDIGVVSYLGIPFRTDKNPINKNRLMRGIYYNSEAQSSYRMTNQFQFIADSQHPANSIPEGVKYDFEVYLNFGTAQGMYVPIESVVFLIDGEVAGVYDTSNDGIYLRLNSDGTESNSPAYLLMQSGRSGTSTGEGNQLWECDDFEIAVEDKFVPPSPTGAGIYLGSQRVCTFDQLTGLNADYSNMFSLASSAGYVDSSHSYSVIFDEPTTSVGYLDPDRPNNDYVYESFKIPEGWKIFYNGYMAKNLEIPSTVTNLGNFGSRHNLSVVIDQNNEVYDACGNIVVKLDGAKPEIISVLITADWDTFNNKYTGNVVFNQYAFSRVVQGSHMTDYGVKHKPFVWKPNMEISQKYTFSSRFEDFKISSAMTQQKYIEMTMGCSYIFQYYSGPFPTWESGNKTIPIVHEGDFSYAYIEGDSSGILDLSGLQGGIGTEGFFKASLDGFNTIIIGDEDSYYEAGSINDKAFKDVIINDNLTRFGNVEFIFNKVTNFGNMIIHSAYDSGYWPNIKSITINDLRGSIGNSAFYGLDRAVFNITTGGSDRERSIGSTAFKNASINASEQSLIIPSDFYYIGSNAFENVVHVYYNGTATGRPWGAKNIN